MADGSKPATAKSKPKAYAYSRWSTSEQTKGDSARRQSADVAAFCEKHGLELDTELTMVDAGRSAFRGRNLSDDAALGAFLNAVKDGIVERGSWLLIERLDRLSRMGVSDAVYELQGIVRAGITVATTADGGQVFSRATMNDNPMALIIATVGFATAHDESKKKSDRLRKVWAHKRVKAPEKRMTRLGPGWLTPTEDGGWKLIPERVKVVRRIVAAATRGESVYSIIRALNEDGVPTFRGGKLWGRTYVNVILRSRALIGEFVPHVDTYDEDDGSFSRTPTEPVRNYFPAVLTDFEWQRLRAAVGSKAPLRGAHAGRPMGNILSTLARCPRCKGTMTRVSKGVGNGHPRLVCARAKIGGGCDYIGVHCHLIEATLSDKKNVSWLAEQVPTPDGAAEAAAEAARRTVEAIEAKLHKLMAVAETAGASKSPTLGKRIADLDSQLTEAKAASNAADELVAQSATKLHTVRVAELRTALQQRPIDRLRVNTALRALASEVVVDYTSGRLDIRWKNGGETSLHYAMPAVED